METMEIERRQPNVPAAETTRWPHGLPGDETTHWPHTGLSRAEPSDRLPDTNSYTRIPNAGARQPRPERSPAASTIMRSAYISSYARSPVAEPFRPHQERSSTASTVDRLPYTHSYTRLPYTHPSYTRLAREEREDNAESSDSSIDEIPWKGPPPKAYPPERPLGLPPHICLSSTDEMNPRDGLPSIHEMTSRDGLPSTHEMTSRDTNATSEGPCHLRRIFRAEKSFYLADDRPGRGTMYVPDNAVPSRAPVYGKTGTMHFPHGLPGDETSNTPHTSPSRAEPSHPPPYVSPYTRTPFAEGLQTGPSTAEAVRAPSDPGIPIAQPIYGANGLPREEVIDPLLTTLPKVTTIHPPNGLPAPDAMDHSHTTLSREEPVSPPHKKRKMSHDLRQPSTTDTRGDSGERTIAAGAPRPSAENPAHGSQSTGDIIEDTMVVEAPPEDRPRRNGSNNSSKQSTGDTTPPMIAVEITNPPRQSTGDTMEDATAVEAPGNRGTENGPSRPSTGDTREPMMAVEIPSRKRKVDDDRSTGDIMEDTITVETPPDRDPGSNHHSPSTGGRERLE